MPPGSDSVLIADHDAASCNQLAGLLESLSLTPRIADRGAAALAAAASERFALVLVAVDLPEPCGFEVLYALRERYGRSLAVALLGAACDGVARDEIAGLLLGADDYFEKPIRGDRFLARVRRLARGDGWRTTVPAAGAGRGALTRRESEVLALLSQGLRRPEIADQLSITGKTAATHIERILAKLGAHSQAQAVAYALRDGIVDRHPARASEARAAASSVR